MVTASDKVAEWARTPISLGPGAEIAPLVLGPGAVPIVTDAELAARDPELAVLSVMAHGQGDVETAVNIALTAMHAASSLEDDPRVLYFDLIESALSEAARKAFSMLPHNYQFQGPSYIKGKTEGKLEGKLEGELLMAVANILDVLDARELPVSKQARERVEACTDASQLRHWLRRAAVVRTADELFVD